MKWLILVMSLSLVLLLAVGVAVLTVKVQLFLTQYVLPAPGGQVAHAKHYRVFRRHHESLKSWEDRTVAAADAFHAAADAFVAEAEQQGRLERVGWAGLKSSLPSSHPLSIALVAARYPDGPPPLELGRIALGEVVETGVDMARA
jgi:hypothetical protein